MKRTAQRHFQHNGEKKRSLGGDRTLDKTLALWLNSSLGLLSLIASRVDTRGAWVELKKLTLEGLFVIDPRKLSKRAQEKLCLAYDELAKMEIRALPQLAEDVVRDKIDAAVADALGLKADLSMLRKLLSADPIIKMSLPA